MTSRFRERGTKQAIIAEDFVKNFIPNNVNQAIDAIEALASPQLAKPGQRELLLSLVKNPADIDLIFDSTQTVTAEVEDRVRSEVIEGFQTDITSVVKGMLTRYQAFFSEPVVQATYRRMMIEQDNQPKST